MKILAVEFSSEARSVAVVEALPEGSASREPSLGRDRSPTGLSDERTSRRGFPANHGARVLSTVSETGAGATKAFGLVEKALANARVTQEEINRIAVGLGPGSYMGIRVAIALAQGWQLARGVELIGLRSADTLAAQAHEEGLRGRLHTVIDAQKNEVYLASYELGAEGWHAAAPLRLAAIDEIRSLAAEGGQVVGPEATRWLETGRNLCPQARHLGLMAAAGAGPVQGETLEPIYLRPVSFVKAVPPPAPA